MGKFYYTDGRTRPVDNGALDLLKGDIVCVKSNTVVGGLIRFFSRQIGESRTKINHVGIITKDGPMDRVSIIEARHKVVEHPFLRAYRDKDVKMAIFRNAGLTELQRQKIVDRARHFVGAPYGYFDLAFHFLDWCLLGAYAFRRLTDDDQYPICSWLVAEAYTPAAITFGVRPGQAQPDDIWDHIIHPRNNFMELRPLTAL